MKGDKAFPAHAHCRPDGLTVTAHHHKETAANGWRAEIAGTQLAVIDNVGQSGHQAADVVAVLIDVQHFAALGNRWMVSGNASCQHANERGKGFASVRRIRVMTNTLLRITLSHASKPSESIVNYFFNPKRIYMKNVPDQGVCHFSDLSVFEEFKRELKSVFRNSDLRDVTVNRVFDEVIVVFEWAENTSDFEVSHAITKNVVQTFGGEYRPGAN